MYQQDGTCVRINLDTKGREARIIIIRLGEDENNEIKTIFEKTLPKVGDNRHNILQIFLQNNSLQFGNFNQHNI